MTMNIGSLLHVCDGIRNAPSDISRRFGSVDDERKEEDEGAANGKEGWNMEPEGWVGGCAPPRDPGSGLNFN